MGSLTDGPAGEDETIFGAAGGASGQMPLQHALHVFQSPCCLLEVGLTCWYTKLSGATVKLKN